MQMKKATGQIIDEEFGFMPTTKVNQIDLVRVPTELDMVERNTAARRNELEGVVKSMKKPEQELLDKEVAKLGMNLNTFGKSDIDLMQQAGASLSHAAGVHNAGNDIAQTLPNIRALVPEEEVENDDDDDDDQDDDDDPEPEAGAKKKGKKGEASVVEEEDKWWPREALCLDKERELEALVETQRKAVEEERDKLKKYYEAIGLYVDVKSVCLVCNQF